MIDRDIVVVNNLHDKNKYNGNKSLLSMTWDIFEERIKNKYYEIYFYGISQQMMNPNHLPELWI